MGCKIKHSQIFESKMHLAQVCSRWSGAACVAVGGALGSHHVPEEVGDPVDQGADATDELEMLGLGDPFLYQVEHKACWDEGHGKDHAYGHHRIHRRGQTGEGNKTFKDLVGNLNLVGNNSIPVVIV